MPIIIDGWNFIRDKCSALRNKEPLEAATALISFLQTFQAGKNDPIILVFDSSHSFLNIPYRSSPKFKIVAVENADNFIKKFLDKLPANQRRNFRVVSSDLDIFDYSRQSQATALKSAEFWQKLKKKMC